MMLKSLPIAILALSTMWPSLNAYAQKPQKHLGNQIELLFYQHADSGRVSKDRNDPHCYRIKLNGINEHVIYVSDEPARVTGVFNMHQFMETWRHNENVEKIHPNAILHAKIAGKKDAVNDVATFSDLQYSARTKTLRYTACPVDKKKNFVEGQIDDVSLFIDPFHPWPP